MPELWVLGGLIIAAWIIQIALSWRQALAFSHRIADMRRSGTVAVGLGRGRFRGRVYAVCSVGRDGRVTGAEVLRGWSTLSNAKPIPNLVGLPYEDLCGTGEVEHLDKPLRDALCQVVATLRDAAQRQPGEGGAPIAQKA